MKPVHFSFRGMQRSSKTREPLTRKSRRRARVNASLACLALASSTAFAAAANPDATPSDAPEADLNIQAQQASQWTGVWTRSTLLGDMGGLRPWLGKYGVTLQATETSAKYLANVRGGLRTGGTYDGLHDDHTRCRYAKGVRPARRPFNVSALQIHGRNLSEQQARHAEHGERHRSGRLPRVSGNSGISSRSSNKRIDVKVGQQSIDQEFMVSQYSATFVNTMFGWPGLPSYDMPSGGPAYPLSALGVRVRGQITPSLTALAGVFDGDPLGNNPNNKSGTNFNLHNGALLIGELQYAINQPAEGEMVGAPSTGCRAPTSSGVWYNNGSFADQHFDNTGMSLANPTSTGIAAESITATTASTRSPTR